MESPSQQELEILLERRGKKALAMYAWRGAMRALPLLGRTAITKVWGDNAITHSYSVLRVHLLLYWYCTGEGHDDINLAQASNYAYDAYAAVNVASAAFAASAASAAASAATTTATIYACAVNASTVATAAEKANREDYQFLLNHSHPIAACYRQPLWPDAITDELSENGACLLNDLKANQLGFLADDIERLYKGEDLPNHAKRYLETPSESVSASASVLRAFILGKDIGENQAVRAMLIGPGGAGKTSLWQLLSKRQVEEKPAVTKGVKYHDHTPINLYIHEPALAGINDWQDLDLYLWDFGGQAIFHSLHSAFMKENCVYILVVDSRHEQAPDEWLHQIDDLTGGNAEVLLVTNYFDEVEREQNITSLLRRFKRILARERFFNFDCRSADDDFDNFVKTLVETALTSRRKILPCVQQAAEILDTRFSQQEYIDLRKLTIALKETIEAEQVQHALDGLKVLGRVVPLVGKDYCLKPEWIINQAYSLLSSPVAYEKQGMVDDPLVWQILETKTESADDSKLSEQVLGFLHSLDLCMTLDNHNHNLNNNYDDFDHYFIPDAAVASEPEQVKDLVAKDNTLTFAYELSYIPAKLKAQLIKHLWNLPDVRLDLPDGVWRDGVIVYAGGRSENIDSNDLIVVEYQYRKQRIELTLVGEPDGELPKLLGAIDNAFEKISGRQLIGHMRFEDKGKDLPCSAYDSLRLTRSEQTNQQQMIKSLVKTSKELGQPLVIKVENNVNTNSNNTTVTGGVTNSAIGNESSNKANISNSFNTDSFNTNNSLNSEQQADLIAALNQLLEQTLKQGANATKVQLLADAKGVVEQDAAPTNEQTTPFLHKLYGAMTEFDKVAGMAEKANKYVAPLVSAGALFLAGI